MKTTNVLASLLLSSLAAAAPVNKRDYLTKTELVMETVVVYTTVYDDGEGAPATAAAGPTSAAGQFYQQHPTPSAPSKQPEQPSKAPAAPSSPSSVYIPPVVTTPAYTPPAVSTPAYTPPAASPVVPQQPSAAQPSQPAQQTGGSTGGSGEGVNKGDITIYDSNGDLGACGKPVYSTDFTVALSKDTFGKSQYNVMTGEATNPWCGQKIKIFYNGNSIEATIMDLCPGCSGQDIDLTMAAWTKLTGTTEKTRYKASWSKI